MPRPVGLRNTVVFVIGVVMIALGAVVALRPLWAGPAPLTASRWLDVAFALFFLLRGLMNVRTSTGRALFGAPRPAPPDRRPGGRDEAT